MIIEKPRIDREAILADEDRRHRIADSLRLAADLLQPMEELGMPVRRGDVIEIPILVQRAVPPSDDVLEELADRALHEHAHN